MTHRCYRVKYESNPFGFRMLAAHIIRQAMDEQEIFPIPFAFWRSQGFETLCGYVHAEPGAVLRVLKTKAPVAVETTGACALRVEAEITLDKIDGACDSWQPEMIPDLILPWLWIPATTGIQDSGTEGICSQRPLA